jgi:lipoprotein-anchoring transpeptidase ErfK/SrfK
MRPLQRLTPFLLSVWFLPAAFLSAATEAGPALEKSTRPSAITPILPVNEALVPPAEDADLWLRVQIALGRNRFSCGPIDGVKGAQTTAALYAFQESRGLPRTGELDTATAAALLTDDDRIVEIIVTTEDVAGLQPVSPTWLGKSQQTSLSYESVLELIAERTHASTTLLQRINPEVNWDQLMPGAVLRVPAVALPPVKMKAAQIRIGLSARILQVRDDDGRLVAHFPVSIAREEEKRPEGDLRVAVVVADPDYTFDPEVFKESDEARSLGRKLILPPGPNNPVGVAWIGLDRPGYGIHGTPHPEKVGRTESHGCFRLANWDARSLLAMAWTGLPVVVEP